ncbi:hypothetical protein [Flavobacterium sp.]|uniref:hypothetical protein n=1 Tax=Flavobacterium sp. TaxID=239 RepID=UPI003B995FA6
MKLLIKSAFLFVCLGVVSCKDNIPESDLAYLNGYWEIEKVELPDGDKKEYKVNESIDFIQVKSRNGIRKKVYPQIDGRYLVNDVQERFTVTDSAGNWLLRYETRYGKWSEKIIAIDSSSLEIAGAAGAIYFYKRPQPFSIK